MNFCKSVNLLVPQSITSLYSRCVDPWCADVVDIDTAGLAALEELNGELVSRGIQVWAMRHTHFDEFAEKRAMQPFQVSSWKLDIAPCPLSLSENKHIVQMAIANPGWKLVHKLKLARLVDRIGESWIFLTVGEAVEACLGNKKGVDLDCWIHRVVRSLPWLNKQCMGVVFHIYI